MHNTESIFENETRKLLWDFEIQTDHLISVRRQDFVKVNKKENQLNKGLSRLGRSQSKF